jgi:hypothetical protein
MYLKVCGGGETTWKYCSLYQLLLPFYGSLSEIRKIGPECERLEAPVERPEGFA